MNPFIEMFRDPEAIRQYAEGPPRFMPGYADMQLMTAILLAERADADSEILVLGAGGGLELCAFADFAPGWRLTGVAPAGAMLELARVNLGEWAERATLIEGLIGDAPPGPFDGACCLLTLHFLPAEERLQTLLEIRARLAPGAAFVAAHSSFPQAPEATREQWLGRYAAFAAAKGADAEMVEKARAAVSESVQLLDPATDEELMRHAGFTGVAQFYAGFTWRGWVGYA